MKLSKVTTAALIATGTLMLGGAYAQNGAPIVIPTPTVRDEPAPVDPEAAKHRAPPVVEDRAAEPVTQDAVIAQPQAQAPRPGRRATPSARPSTAQAPESCTATEDTGAMGCPS